MIISLFTVSSFAQNGQTITLVFVTAASETYKNYEAVIDDVSYYSENTAGNNRISNNRNTIWLNNFQPGQHTIQVYSLKNGSNEERATGTPVYTSTFNVRQGFDTKMAVRNNGQVQFSERHGVDNSNQNTIATNNGDYNRNTKDGNGDYSNGNNQNREKNDQDNSTTNNANDETVNNDGNNNGNNDNGTNQNRRKHDRNNSTKNNGNDRDSDGTNQNRRMKRDRNNTNTDGEYDNQNKDYNNKAPMSDDQFTQLKETISKQWIPGSKMTAVRNEFVINGHNFTTLQAKELIEFVTDENNRMELAKASYPTITDPDNFRQIYDVFRNQSSKDEMDKFIRNYQN